MLFRADQCDFGESPRDRTLVLSCSFYLSMTLGGFSSIVEYLMYADDLKIFRTIKGASDVDLLQADLTRFERWCSANGMRLNTAKCVLLKSHRAVCGILSRYLLCDTTLSEVAEVLDLGVTFTAGLDFP